MSEQLGTAKSIVDVSTDTAKHGGVKPQKLKLLLSEYWFALGLGMWLCLLPILLRLRPLPVILERFTFVRREPNKRSPLEIDRAVQIVVRICRLGFFHLPLFPRACLRQALALYRTLNRMGCPVEIHFGIRKDGKDLQGHSWVTIEGKPVADRTRTDAFRAVYSYPPVSCPSTSDETSQFLQSVYSDEEVTMEKEKDQLSPQEQEGDESTSSQSLGKKPWQEPKLAFVEPKLTKHGELDEVTGQGFFGAFTPK